MLKFNKGEWSEPYCLLKIMANKKLVLCNQDLQETGEYINVTGGRIADNIDYKICGNAIKINFGNNHKECSTKYICVLSSKVLAEIQKQQPRTFPIPELEKFFNEIDNPSLKSNSTNKADCIISVFDKALQSNQNLRFSIKSFLAGSPTLINAGRTTNFTYSVKSLDQDVSDLKAKTLIKTLNKMGSSIKYQSMDSDIYHKNLMLIDTQMPIMISEILKIYYNSKIKTISDIVEILRDKNPVNMQDTSLYKNKIKDFLFYSAIGMFPNKQWEGTQDVNGGCLIVKSNGDVLAFYIFRKELLFQFREYLYNKCFLDTASTTRHNFGRIYQENGINYIKLNLQVRIS